VGNSLGGIVSLQTAALKPSQVLGLVFINTPGNFADAVTTEGQRRQRRGISAVRPFRSLSVTSSMTLRRIRRGQREREEAFGQAQHDRHARELQLPVYTSLTRRQQMAATAQMERRFIPPSLPPNLPPSASQSPSLLCLPISLPPYPPPSLPFSFLFLTCSVSCARSLSLTLSHTIPLPPACALFLTPSLSCLGVNIWLAQYPHTILIICDRTFTHTHTHVRR